jgi:tetratricopeptide (TPR) repeat protein
VACSDRLLLFQIDMKRNKLKNIADEKELVAYEAGNKAFLQNDFKKAVEMWSIHLTNEAKDTKVYSNRSLAYMKLSQPLQALSDAEMVISLEPEWSKGYFRKGQALAAQFKYLEAQSMLTTALNKDHKGKAGEVESIQKDLDYCLAALSELKLEGSALYQRDKKSVSTEPRSLEGTQDDRLR